MAIAQVVWPKIVEHAIFVKTFGGPGRLKKACIQRKCLGSNIEQATGVSLVISIQCTIHNLSFMMLSKVQTRSLKLR